MIDITFNSTEKTILFIGMGLVILWLALVTIWFVKMLKKYTWNPKMQESGVFSKETLNMPRGTLRGALTLTLLVVVIIFVGVTMFVTQLKGQFDTLINAFELMIAFYFGSKVMHHITSSDKEKTRKKSEVEAQKAKYNSTASSIGNADFEVPGSEG